MLRISFLPQPRRAKYPENKSAICARGVFRSHAPRAFYVVLLGRSFTLILLADYYLRPEALLTIMAAFLAQVIIFYPSIITYEECHLSFHLLTHSWHPYHLPFYCNVSGSFLRFFSD